MGDWIFVEGQGSLDHPAYSPVTLGLVHGATPHAMVLVHEPGRSITAGRTCRALARSSRCPTHPRPRAVAALVAPSRVLGRRAQHVALLAERRRAREIARDAAETGLPTDDPVRFGASGCWTRFASGWRSGRAA